LPSTSPRAILAAMSWRLHLRDLVLAGGTIATAACSSGSSGSAGSSGAGGVNNFFCCNANPDPCCESQYCGAPVSKECMCKEQGGDWTTHAPDGGFLCTFEAGTGDGG
jgi:hypothetical protein